MLEHPLRYYRREKGLTQRGLAEHLETQDLSLFGNDTVSEQWVRRLELGLVNPDTNFLPVVNALAPTEGMINRYTLLLVETAPAIELATDKFPHPVNHIHDWYRVLRYAARQKLEPMALTPESLLSEINAELNNQPTVYAFCRSLGLHPFTVQTWVKENKTDMVDWPKPIRDALKEVGVIEADW